MLEPRGHVHEQREARRMRLRKSVFAESFDLVEDALRELVLVAALAIMPSIRRALETLEIAVAPPRGHRAAQLVGLARA